MANTATKQTISRNVVPAMTNCSNENTFVPEGKVFFRNLKINSLNRTFSIEYGFFEGKKRKVEYTEVRGAITQDLYDWCTNVFTRKDYESESTYETTGFKMYLERKGIEFKKGILREMEWSCDNRSGDSDDFPFRLTINNHFGTAVLNRVTKFPRYLVDKRMNPETGVVYKSYDYAKYRNMRREQFRRLEISTSNKEIEGF